MRKRVFAASRFDKTVHHLVCGDDFFVWAVGRWRRYDFEGFLCIPIKNNKISKIVSGTLPGQNNQFGGGQHNHQNWFSPIKKLFLFAPLGCRCRGPIRIPPSPRTTRQPMDRGRKAFLAEAPRWAPTCGQNAWDYIRLAAALALPLM